MKSSATIACKPPRQAGVLLHITSLPGSGYSCLGAQAFRFVDFLADAGFRVWQVLPINPVGMDGSPYQATSAFAGNPEMIDLAELHQQGWLAELDDMAPICQLIWDTWQGFCRYAGEADRKDFADFIERQAYWLDDYALFYSIHTEQEKPWWEWPAQLRHRSKEGLDKVRARLADRITCARFEQYLFYRQWRALKHHANERGVSLFGDVPIFVAHDSAEVWSRPHLFELDEEGQPTLVAGVPPDYFSATGQRWGNPLYRWDVMHADDYAFWEQRIKTQLELFDLIRIDHFRGFESYWAIPASEEYAINGSWMPGPGEALFKRLKKKLGKLPLVAEDLGVITDEVRELKGKLNMPGMKILQFAFSGDADNPYLPYNHERCSVVYTGTHDNDTTLGWYADLSDGEREHVNHYLGHPQEPMPWPLIRLALGSRSQLAIIPMQDLLALAGEHRMNTPGTTEGNWHWSFTWEQIPEDLGQRLHGLLGLYGRIN
ncbi:4-alpha-glucanotransferase [Magnetovirga frankeli]|uniref:4-alpha-glucanotransferase n=1 Tax=Magnetovirga frankeli TaxID=947516 RepID=UPI001AF0E491|nr:4-alpha-glucanotransferase [gamma proteobacterium SS-5]